MAILLSLALLVMPVGTWRDAQARLAVRFPRGWHVTTRELTPVTDPVERFAIYSGPVPRPLGPPKARQVIAIVMEVKSPLRVDLVNFPKRPHHFRLSRLGMLEGFSGKHWGELTFRDHGRAFYVFVGVGRQADAQLPNSSARSTPFASGRLERVEPLGAGGGRSRRLVTPSGVRLGGGLDLGARVRIVAGGHLSALADFALTSSHACAKTRSSLATCGTERRAAA